MKMEVRKNKNRLNITLIYKARSPTTFIDVIFGLIYVVECSKLFKPFWMQKSFCCQMKVKVKNEKPKSF